MYGFGQARFRASVAFISAISTVWLLLLTAGVFAADESISAGINKPVYAPSENMTIAGTVYSGTSPAASLNVSISVNGGAATVVTTDSNGTFSTSAVQAPATEGTHTLNVSAGDATINFSFEVTDVTGVIVELVNNTIVVPLTRSGGWANGTAEFPSGIVNNFSVLNSSTIYDTAFVNGLSFLTEGASVPIENKTFAVVYIDPQGSTIVLGERVSVIFFGTGSETVNVLVVKTNATKNPAANKNVTIQVFDDKGDTVVNLTTTGLTDGNGTKVFQYNVTVTDAGMYHIIVNSIGHVSYLVQKYKLVASLMSPDGDPLFLVAPGQAMVAKVSVLNLTTGLPISASITASADITFPNGTVLTESLSLVNGSVTENVTAPPESGRYSVEITTNLSGQVQRAFLEFEVRSSQFSAFPVAAKRGPTEGFAPGEPAVMFVTGRDMGTGDLLNLTNLTSECNLSFVNITEIRDADGNNVLSGSVGGHNLTYFFANQSVPDFVQQDMKDKFGVGACVLYFQAPATSGLYDVVVNVSVAGGAELHSAIGVQDVFINSYPVSSTGSFQWAISPGGDVYLAINGYDPASGSTIDVSDILDAKLIEVINEDGKVVTDLMSNESFGSLSGGSIKALHFVANDTRMGFHHVRFRATINVTRNSVETTVNVIGSGWFMEKLYQVFVYPPQGKWSFGSNAAVNMTVEVKDSAGVNGQQGVQAQVAEVFAFETQQSESLSQTGNLCTTNSNGTCTLTITPNSTWSSGGHQVRITIKDSNDNTDQGWGWFEIRNFMFWAWPQDWEVSKDQALDINLQISEFDGTGLNNTNVTIDKLLYFGTGDNWQHSPSEINDSIGISKLINSTPGVSGNVTLPANSGVTKEGQYAVLLTAVAGDGRSETARAWFYSRPFIIFADVPGNLEKAYGPTDLVNITVKGYDSIDWSTWPPTGTGHNLSAAWVASIEKEGAWDSTFKTKDQLQLQNNMSSSCSGGTCQLTFNLTGFAQGGYSMQIKANDTSDDRASTWFWMRFEVLKIRAPELISWITVRSTDIRTNRTNFTLAESCGTDVDAVIEPANVSNCVADSSQILEKLAPNNPQPANTTYFLLDKNSTQPKLYVNYTKNETTNTVNFSTDSPLTVGKTFNDINGRNWTIADLDASTGVVTLQATKGIIGEDFGQRYLITINQSLSKSGKFLQGMAPRDGDFDIDLDGDGAGFEDNYLLLADSATGGFYDSVLLSNTTNFTNYVTGAGAINFTPAALPIYLLGLRFEAGSGGSSDTYQLTFTTNKPSYWGGRNLGTFPSGSIIKVPIIVTAPNGTSFGAGVRVNVTQLIKFGGFSFEKFPGANATALTNAAGLALLEVNSSGISSGSYFVEVQARDPSSGSYISPGNLWDNPQIEIRNFVVQGALGQRAQVAVSEVSAAANNLFTYRNSSIFRQNATNVSLDCLTSLGDCATTNVSHVTDWFFHSVWYNKTSDRILVDQTPDDNDVGTGPVSVFNWRTQIVPVLGRENGGTGLFNITVDSAALNINYIAVSAPNASSIEVPSYSEPFFKVTDLGDGTELLLWNDVALQNPSDYYGWKGQMDQILLINATNGLVIANESDGTPFEIGDVIGALGKSVVKAELWAEEVTLTNATFSQLSQPLRALPWSCDNAPFYKTSFNESDIGFDLNNNFQNTNGPYYMLLYDQNCDGVAKVTNALIDDDTKFAPDYTTSAWDYDEAELTTNATSESGMPYQERWLSIGGFSWPFSIITDVTGPGPIDLFAYQSFIQSGENVTLYVTAKTFAGLPVNGNVSVKKITTFTYGCSGGPVETDVTSTVNASAQPVVNGAGFLMLNAGNLSSGDYSAAFRVVNNATNQEELLEQHFYISGSFGGGSGGGGGVGGGGSEGGCGPKLEGGGGGF